MRFEFATANRIVFGTGTIRELAPAAASLGKRALMVVGKSDARAAAPRMAVEGAGVRCALFSVRAEPNIATVQAGVSAARAEAFDMVIAIGGGSAIDAGKAIAAILPNPGEIRDYLEGVGHGQTLPKPSLPLIAVPTTAGTGSEVTRNAVLTVPDQRVKVSLRGPTLLPHLAIVDPELTYGLPPDVTAACGMDALAQLIEPYVSTEANPLTDALCLDGIGRIACSIRRACGDGEDAVARADMALAALFSGMALANAKLGAVHGFAGPIGGLCGAPHGAICGRLLPPVTRVNLRALRQRSPGSDTLKRYENLARLLTGRADATCDDGVQWLEVLCTDLGLPPLGAYGMSSKDLPEVISRAAHSSSMRGNPVVLTEAEMAGALQAAL